MLPKDSAKVRSVACLSVRPSVSPPKDVWRDGMCPLSARHQWHFLSFSLSLPVDLSFRCQRQTASCQSVGRSIGGRSLSATAASFSALIFFVSLIRTKERCFARSLARWPVLYGRTAEFSSLSAWRVRPNLRQFFPRLVGPRIEKKERTDGRTDGTKRPWPPIPQRGINCECEPPLFTPRCELPIAAVTRVSEGGGERFDLCSGTNRK